MIQLLSLCSCIILASSTIQEDIKKNEEGRHQFLASFSDFDLDSSPLNEVSNYMNDMLELSDSGADWVDFFFGKENVKEVMTSKDLYGIGQSDLNKQVMEMVEQQFPPINEEIKNNKFFKEGGFMTLIPYANEHFKRVVHNYYVSQLFSLSEKNSEEIVAFPNEARQIYINAMIRKIHMYINYFNPVPEVHTLIAKIDKQKKVIETTNEKEAQEITEANQKKLDEATEIIKNYVVQSQNNEEPFLFVSVVNPFTEIANFRINLSYYMIVELDLQTLYFENENSEDTKKEEMIISRLHELVSVMVKIYSFNQDKNIISRINSHVAKLYGLIFERESSEKITSEFAKATMGWIQFLRTEIEEKEAMTLVKKLINKRITLSPTSSSFIPKSRLGYTIWDEEDPTESVVRMIEALIEFDDKNWNSEQERIDQVLEHVDLVLNAPSAMFYNVNQARAVFSEHLIKSESNQEIFAKLHQTYVSLIAEKYDIKLENFGLELNNLIDETFKDPKNDGRSFTFTEYFVIKALVAFKYGSPEFSLSFVKPSEEELASLTEALEGNELANISNLVIRCLKNLAIPVYKQTPMSDRVKFVVESDKLTNTKFVSKKLLLI